MLGHSPCPPQPHTPTRQERMSHFPHHVSGFFATRADAQSARESLLQRGLPAGRMQIHASDASPTPASSGHDSNAVLKDVVVDGAVGTAVGTGLGALAQVALVAGNVSLFVASPLLAPLAMMGWGAGLGGLLGAALGATTEPAAAPAKEGWLSQLVADAIAQGQFVLVVQTLDEAETRAAREVIEAAVGGAQEAPPDPDPAA